MTEPGLIAYLIVGAALFGIGVAAVLSQRNTIMVLMGIEIILTAAVLNLMAFWRFGHVTNYDAHVFAIVVITVGAVDMAAGLGLALLLFRKRGTSNVDEVGELKR